MITILQGDWIEQLRTLPDESVQCCVTSPPYWGLRDYGTASWYGGSESCDHKQGRPGAGRADGIVDDRSQRNRDGVGSMGGDCQKCGAKRIDQQLGLERTPEEYVAKIVQGFAQVRRALANDGTLWLNLGDSFAANGMSGIALKGEASTLVGTRNIGHTAQKKTVPLGLKPKDLVGIPWMVAFALRADGWYLRSDIIWAKPNPMPESVTDRPTKSHEYIFLLTKSQRYYYDAEAIKEKASQPMGIPTLTAQHKSTANGFTTNGTGNSSLGTNQGFETRNKRSVWTVSPMPYSEAHFATFPPDLIKPCILAGSKAGDTILDPFGGSGTTGMVAIELGRSATLIELNPDYIKLIEQRTNVTMGLAL